MATPAVPRPQTPAGFDASRAAERAQDPTGWRLSEQARDGLREAILGRRDIRRFRPDPVPDDALTRLLEAAHAAPSVGFLQPWRFIVVRSATQRARVHALADRERIKQAARIGQRATHFMEQKVEGIREAPLGVLVCCAHPPPTAEVLGRGTIPQTDSYSTACAVQNLWLQARAEGLGVGWVSFYEEADMQAVFGLPAYVEPLAYLCVGYPDERPVRPGLESAGWAPRTPLAQLIHTDRWEDELPDAAPPGAVADHAAAVAVRDRSDQLLKPAGSLGALERALERWAAVTGDVPPVPLRAGILVATGDHAVAARGTSLWGEEVSGQLAGAAAAGQTAIGVLARHDGHRLIVADLGLRGETPPGVQRRRVVDASADFTAGPALTQEQAAQALQHGADLADELLDAGVACLVVGEIGIGNTTAAAALGAALLDLTPEQAIGRGAGLDAAGLERKRAAVRDGLARHLHGRGLTPSLHERRSLELLRRLGGAELVALAGAIARAAQRRTPVVLDGFATGVVALAVVQDDPSVRDVLIAAHRSTEPAHQAVLAELGLEPLLDLRLRLGEASGAALALPLLEQAALLHREMGTFAEAGVDPRT